MAVAKLGQLAVKALTSAKGTTSIYKQALSKIANVIPDMVPTTFTMSEVQTILKFKGIQNKSLFEAGQALLGDGATLTLVKRASRSHALHEGASIMGAVLKKGDGEIVAKGAMLVDDAKGTISVKFRSGILDWNSRYNPNNITPKTITGSKIRISGDYGAVGKESIDLKVGNILDTVADDVATTCGVKKSVVLQDMGDFAKKQILDGANPVELAEELSKKYSTSTTFMQQESKYTAAFNKLLKHPETPTTKLSKAPVKEINKNIDPKVLNALKNNKNLGK